MYVLFVISSSFTSSYFFDTLIIIQFSKTFAALPLGRALSFYHYKMTLSITLAVFVENMPQGRIISGGGGQIRTAEPVGSRFTVYRV